MAIWIKRSTGAETVKTRDHSVREARGENTGRY